MGEREGMVGGACAGGARGVVNLARDSMCGFLSIYIIEYIVSICVVKVLMNHLRASGSVVFHFIKGYPKSVVQFGVPAGHTRAGRRQDAMPPKRAETRL